MENCNQTDIPVVDNSQQACDAYYNAMCIIYEKTAPFIGITTDDKSVEQVVDAIVAKLQTQSTLIASLQATIAAIDGASYNVATPSAAYTALVTDDLVLLDGFDVTLYAASAAVKPIRIKNIGTTIQYINRAGTDTIEGDTSLELQPQESIIIFPIVADFRQL